MKEFGLSKSEVIRSKKDFELIFEAGKTVFSANGILKATYIILDEELSSNVKVAFGVYKKAGKAFWRNRVKRLLRESFRLNKHSILTKANSLKKTVLIVFQLNRLNRKYNKNVVLQDIMPEVIDLLKKIESDIK